MPEFLKEHDAAPPDVYTANENDVDGPIAGNRGAEVLSVPPADTGVEFVSKSELLRLVYRPSDERWDRGRIVEKWAEEAVEFQNGRYTVGLDQKFSDGQSVLEWMRGHENFNREFAGFVEVPPITPLPSTVELQEITLAAMARDEDKLVDMLEREQAGHRREEVLSPLRAALEALERLNAAEAPKPAKPATRAAK